MKKSTHFYSLNSKWQHHLTQEEDKNVLDKEIVFIPETLGQGQCYFTQIAAGISVFFIDFTLTSPIKINSFKSENEFYIFHFDLSEKTNVITIDNIEYETGAFDGPGLAVLSSDLESSFLPALGERTVVLRIQIDKNLLSEFFKDHESEGSIIEEIALNKKAIRYHNNMDSNSILLIQSIKKKSYLEALFEPYLKGISLKLIGNFLSRNPDLKDKKNKIPEIEKKAIIETREYLLENLYGPFPSIDFLSKMARMSPSRYISLFRLKYGTTPNNFFTKEKILLSHKLLKSGNYSSLTEIIYELDYSRISYFSSIYYTILNRKPTDDFVKKATFKF